MRYKLEVIPGTKNFVLKELFEKFSDVEIIEHDDERTIEFSSSFEDVDTFQSLLSPLRIQKENGLIRNLFRREWKVVSSPASINPSLAFILCMIAEVDENHIVYDPFCGSGTIGITAAKYFNAKKVLCSDLSGKAVDWTVENLKAAGIKKNKIVAFRSNISQIKLQKESVDIIVSNLPFGIRIGDHKENQKIYDRLFSKGNVILRKGGKMILYTQEKELVREMAKKYKFEITEEIVIEQGKLYPSIFSISRK